HILHASPNVRILCSYEYKKSVVIYIYRIYIYISPLYTAEKIQIPQELCSLAPG
ncbi:hypothetical protein L9F63_014866, partial [Diploptera punctata]